MQGKTKVAVITAIGACLAALITGVFLLLAGTSSAGQTNTCDHQASCTNYGSRP